jgi:hypothetical protein
MPKVTNLRPFLMAIKRLHGVINIDDPREKMDGGDGGAVLLIKAYQGGGFVQFLSAAHHLLTDGAPHPQLRFLG